MAESHWLEPYPDDRLGWLADSEPGPAARYESREAIAINAQSMEQAIELAGGCPLLNLGGGVEIGELTRLSEDTLSTHLSDHPATA
jgi:hypothetical protein